MIRLVALLSVLAVVLFVPAGSAGATALPEKVTSNTTLTKSGGPYTGSWVYVEKGATLTIEPGTVIKISGVLSVKGAVEVNGSAGEPVVFTSLRDDSAGGDTNEDGSSTAPKRGDWGGVEFSESSAGFLRHARISYGGLTSRYATIYYDCPCSNPPNIENSTIDHGSSTAISGRYASPSIRDNTIDDNAENGISLTSGSPEIVGNTVTDNMTGIAQSVYSKTHIDVDINDNVVEGNTYTGIYVYAATGDVYVDSASLGGNVVKGNGGKGIVYDGFANVEENPSYSENPVPSNITTNTVLGNGKGGIWVAGAVTEDQTWEAAGYPLVISSNALSVSKGATLGIDPGTVVKLEHGSIYPNGIIDANGTPEDPVVFTSYRDDSVGGDTNGDGSASTPKPGDWLEFRFLEGSGVPGASSFVHTKILYGGATSYPWDSMIEMRCPCANSPEFVGATIAHSATSAINGRYASPSIRESTIEDNAEYGIWLMSGSPEIVGNTVTDNMTGIAQSVYSKTHIDVEIDDNVVEDNTYGGIYVGAGTGDVYVDSASLGGNVVKGNGERAIVYEGFPNSGENPSYSENPIPSNITTNTVSGNGKNGIWIGGAVTEDQIWEATSYALVVFNNGLNVSKGATLTIDPGTVIKNEARSIYANGTIDANGTAEDPVYITSYRDDSVGGDTNGDAKASEPKPGDWTEIRFPEGSGVPAATSLTHTKILYGGDAYYPWDSMIEMRCPCAHSPEFVKSTFSYSNTSAINGRYASPSIRESTIEDNAEYGIWLMSGSPEIVGNTVKGNMSGIVQGVYSNTHADVDINDNVVEDNTYTGISVNAETGTQYVDSASLGGNSVKGNGEKGIRYEVFTNAAEDPNWAFNPLPPNITSNFVEENGSDVLLLSGLLLESQTWENPGIPLQFNSSGIIVPAGTTLKIKPNVFVRTPRAVIRGTLLAQGTASYPVVFTGVGELSSGEWGGIKLESGSGGSILDYVELGYGGSGEPMLNINGVAPQVTNSTFRRSSADAIRVQASGAPTIEWNRFRNNNYGLRYEGEGKLAALHNDWGCANGPKPTGCGDQVSTNVEWKPAAVLQELTRRCPGTGELASSSRCLLNRYAPTLRYDGEENYFASSAAGITDNWGDEESGLWGENKLASPYTNSLWDADAEMEGPNYGLLAQSQPGVEFLPYQLTLSALGATYPNGHPADSNDWLGENENYLEDSRRLEAGGYQDVAYGRALSDGSGKRWLLYWYWYYYNPKSVGGFGSHEGDWESVVVGLDEHNKPEDVVYSQHTGGAKCDIDEAVTEEEGGPVVYVAQDSHANYPLPGQYSAPVGSDHADGEGESVRPSLVVIDSSPPNWVSWPGHWGNSRAGVEPFESNSPTGPAFHSAWEAPDTYAEGAGECDQGFESSEFRSSSVSAKTVASLVSLSFRGKRPQVTYRVPGADGEGFWPRLRITVDELGDGGLPPISKTVGDLAASSQVTMPTKLNPRHEAVLRGSLYYKDGRRVHLPSRRVR